MHIKEILGYEKLYDSFYQTSLYSVSGKYACSEILRSWRVLYA